MKQMKRKGNWFMRFPILPAFAVPFLSILGMSILLDIIVSVIIINKPDLMRIGEEISKITSSILRIMIAFLIILIMKLGTKGRFKFGFNRKNIKLSFILASFSVLMIADNIIEGFVFTNGLQTTAIGFFVAIIGEIAPGFFEEVVCRGLVLSNMMDKWQTKKNYVLKSVLMSGIAFGVIHLINLGCADMWVTILQVFYAAGVGIFFGAVYVRTRNLWGPVAMHALIDIAYYLFIWPEGFHLNELISGICITVVFTVIGLYLIRPQKQEEIVELWEEK